MSRRSTDLESEILETSAVPQIVHFEEDEDVAAAAAAGASASRGTVGPKSHQEILADFKRDYAAHLKLVSPEKSPGVPVAVLDPEAVKDGAVLAALSELATAEDTEARSAWSETNNKQLILSRIIQKVFAFKFLETLDQALPDAAYAVLGRSAPAGSPLRIEDTPRNRVFSRIAMLLVHVKGLSNALGVTMGPVGNFTIRRGDEAVDFLVNDTQRTAPQIKEFLKGDELVYIGGNIVKEFDMSWFSESSISTVNEDVIQNITDCVALAKDETIAALRFLTAYLRRHEAGLVAQVVQELGKVAASTTAAVSMMRATQAASQTAPVVLVATNLDEAGPSRHPAMSASTTAASAVDSDEAGPSRHPAMSASSAFFASQSVGLPGAHPYVTRR